MVKNTDCEHSASDLGALVHDLRNRLNSITMSAELAKLEIGSADADAPHPALQCLNEILGACSESADLIESIATVSASEEQSS